MGSSHRAAVWSVARQIAFIFVGVAAFALVMAVSDPTLMPH